MRIYKFVRIYKTPEHSSTYSVELQIVQRSSTPIVQNYTFHNIAPPRVQNYFVASHNYFVASHNYFVASHNLVNNIAQYAKAT